MDGIVTQDELNAIDGMPPNLRRPPVEAYGSCLNCRRCRKSRGAIYRCVRYRLNWMVNPDAHVCGDHESGQSDGGFEWARRVICWSCESDFAPFYVRERTAVNRCPGCGERNFFDTGDVDGGPSAEAVDGRRVRRLSEWHGRRVGVLAVTGAALAALLDSGTHAYTVERGTPNDSRVVGCVWRYGYAVLYVESDDFEPYESGTAMREIEPFIRNGMKTMEAF